MLDYVDLTTNQSDIKQPMHLLCLFGHARLISKLTKL